MKRFSAPFVFLLACSLLPLVAAPASPEERYPTACRLIADADRLSDAGGVTGALMRYQQASAAETAFRKALQADPGFADAHANLATVYLTQQPPSVELARWHYKKALAAGAPRNPDLEKKLLAIDAASSAK